MEENKKIYEKPIAEKVEFDYTDTVSASGKNPCQCCSEGPGGNNSGNNSGHGGHGGPAFWFCW